MLLLFSTDTIRVASLYRQHLLDIIYWCKLYLKSHTHTCIHTHAHTHTHTCICSNMRKRTCLAHTYKSMCMKLSSHMSTPHTCPRTHMPMHARARICMCTSTYTHTCIHAHTHAHTCMRKYTYINNKVSSFFY